MSCDYPRVLYLLYPWLNTNHLYNTWMFPLNVRPHVFFFCIDERELIYVCTLGCERSRELFFWMTQVFCNSCVLLMCLGDTAAVEWYYIPGSYWFDIEITSTRCWNMQQRVDIIGMSLQPDNYLGIILSSVSHTPSMLHGCTWRASWNSSII